LAFVGLVWLVAFSQDPMLRKANRKVISIQSIGYRTIVYFVEETFLKITALTGILSFDAPRTTDDLGYLLSKIDSLKKVCHLYHNDYDIWRRMLWI
jgi:hypothetical protein